MNDQIFAVVVDPNEQVTAAEIPNSLKSFQSRVGGWIQGVFGQGYTMYVDEEGLLKSLPYNRLATEFANREPRNRGMVLYGPAVILGPGDLEGNETNATKETYDYFFEEN